MNMTIILLFLMTITISYVLSQVTSDQLMVSSSWLVMYASKLLESEVLLNCDSFPLKLANL
jgi:hypothetical protein